VDTLEQSTDLDTKLAEPPILNRVGLRQGAIVQRLFSNRSREFLSSLHPMGPQWANCLDEVVERGANHLLLCRRGFQAVQNGEDEPPWPMAKPVTVTAVSPRENDGETDEARRPENESKHRYLQRPRPRAAMQYVAADCEARSRVFVKKC
jgi:hypothetical protein